MLFSSPFFIFLFLPIFLALFLLCRGAARNYVLLLGSIGFYLWGEPCFCVIALGSALLDYQLCKKIVATRVEPTLAKRYLVIGIVANLLLLFYYKYTLFFLHTLAHFVPSTQAHFEFFNVLLPIGISFIVFEKITYLVDVYRGTGLPAKSLLHYLNYVFLFPKLLAGPIIKYHEIADQLHHRPLFAKDFFAGFNRFLRGLIKKVFFADTCSEVVNQVFALPASQLGFTHAWLGVVCFSLQIYFDFSGYSDMALGLARMLGFRLPENFNMPYIAASFTEFWRRWHISLSTWIRDYLYLPLGGNRAGTARTYINLWTCFLLSGLWHGANWTFVIWGAYNGIFLVLDKLFLLKITRHLPRIVPAAITLLFVMLGWVIFRSANFQQVHYYFATLISPHQPGNAFIDLTPDIIMVMILGSFLATAALLPGFNRVSAAYLNWTGRVTLESVVFGTFGFLAICKVVGVSYNPFLYFRF